MTKVVDQDIPPDKYQDLYKAAHPANRVRENAFGTFKFGKKKFGKSRGPSYVKKRYPWRIPPYQGGGERE